MAKTYKGWDACDKIVKDFQRDFKREQKKILNKLSKQILDMIQVRIVEGYGVEEHGGRKKKIKGLKQVTKDARKKKKLASYTSYNFSNQVETGRFVEGLKVRIDKDSIWITPSDDREDMAAAQELNGRPTLYLTQEELDFIIEEIETALLEIWEE